MARRSQLRHHPPHRCRPEIGDISVPKGDYTLFVDISDPDNWAFIVNKKTGEWGLAYDGSQDLGKTRMHMSKPPSMVENLNYTITDNGGGKGTLTLAWEDHSASVPITVQIVTRANQKHIGRAGICREFPPCRYNRDNV